MTIPQLWCEVFLVHNRETANLFRARQESALSSRVTPQEPYYRVLVKTSTATLEHRGEKLPIIPGMIATAEILTGHRTVLQYLMKPVLRGQEALRER